MSGKINEELLKEADELINRSDREIMALALGNNASWSDSYQTVMAIKLKRTLISLNKNIDALRKSLNISSWVVGVMTFVILFLTGVLVWIGVK